MSQPRSDELQVDGENESEFPIMDITGESDETYNKVTSELFEKEFVDGHGRIGFVESWNELCVDSTLVKCAFCQTHYTRYCTEG